MRLLIDGYNLLHVTGVFADRTGPNSLERLHATFLEFLATALEPEQAAQATVVFDAKGRRASGRRTIHHAGITVHYAARHETADAYIVEILQAHHTPRQVLVVSSDHAVQRAARRRRARPIDSAVWYADLMRRRNERSRAPREQAERPAQPLTEQEIRWWVRQFGEERLGGIELDAEERAAWQPGEGRSAETAPPRSGSTAREETLPEVTESRTAKKDKDNATKKTANRVRSKRLGDSGELPLPQPFPPEYLAEVKREIERGS